MNDLTKEQLEESIQLLRNDATFRHLAQQAELELIRRNLTEEFSRLTTGMTNMRLQFLDHGNNQDVFMVKELKSP